jgi:hypothetical protein
MRPKKKILAENSIPLSRTGASISPSIALTSAPFFPEKCSVGLSFLNVKRLKFKCTFSSIFSKRFLTLSKESVVSREGRQVNTNTVHVNNDFVEFDSDKRQ